MSVVYPSHKTSVSCGQSTMSEKQVPWWTLHEVADELGATLRHISCVDSNGRRYKRVVLEYEEEEE
jgi:hypothetical protein